MNSNSYRRKTTTHRALGTVLRTTLAVLLVGSAVTLMSKPVYRATAKLLLDSGATQANDPAGSPMNAVISGGHSIPTQVQVITSEHVFGDACRDADVPPDAVTLAAHQIDNTDVVEIVTESSATPTYAERLAKALPNTYLNSITAKRKTGLMNAIQFSQYRLQEAKDQLKLTRKKRNDMLKSGVDPEEVEAIKDQIEEEHAAVDRLSNSAGELQLQAKLTLDPVSVISPARAAVRVSPNWGSNLLRSGLVGIVLGLFVVGAQGALRRGNSTR